MKIVFRALNKTMIFMTGVQRGGGGRHPEVRSRHRQPRLQELLRQRTVLGLWHCSCPWSNSTAVTLVNGHWDQEVLCCQAAPLRR